MKKTTVIFLSMLLTPAIAFGWKYIVYENDQLAYEGPIPPFDLTYPPPSELTPVMNMSDPLEGTELTPRELANSLSEPHIIIVPASLDIGRPDKTD